MQSIFYNGDIVTMEDKEVEAIFVEDGIIKQTGLKEEIMKLKNKDTKLIDLKGKCLMPAFIDAHSHIMGVAKSLLIADLKEAKNDKDVIKVIEEFKQKNNISNDKWILGYNYNLDSFPNLDIFDNPVLITHISGHTGYLNPKAMKLVGKEGNGYFEEKEFMEIVAKIKPFTLEDLKQSYKEAEKLYLSYGITTAQEGLLDNENLKVLEVLANENKLTLDVIGYTASKINKKYNNYFNHFKVGGYKIFLDGSPTAKTAFLLEPYVGTNNYGVANYTSKELEDKLSKMLKDKKQILIHCNGDAVALQVVNIFTKLKAKFPDFYRPVLIHAQIIGKEELEKLKDLKIIPSFFINHIYHFGDVHIKNLGLKRASNISPAGWAREIGLTYTFHQDSPVLKPNMLESVWCAVNRVTKNNIVLGENQKISVYEALKAVTINAAYQYFEENVKGSIKENKQADLIILDKNPLNTANNKIKDIKVLETFKSGTSVYRNW